MAMKYINNRPALAAGVILACALAGLPNDGQAADGRKIATTQCAECHGVDGNADAGKDVPNIAGQQANYIVKQLKEFASGRRRNEDMTRISTALNDDDSVAVAAWYAGKKALPGKAGDAKLADAGRQIYEDGNGDPAVQPCAVCHQSDGSGNARFPRIAGQQKPYLTKQLGDFKSGRRATDPQMVEIAKHLNANEIKALTEYIGGL